MGIKLFLLVFAVALLSSLSQVVTGFGFAIVLMALMPLFLPYDVCIMISLIFSSLMCVWMLWIFRKGIRFNYILMPAIFSSLGAVAGLIIGSHATPAIYMRLLGILLFVLSIWFLFFSSRVHIKANFMNGAISGIMSGIFGAMFSIGGPPLVLYYGAVTEDRDIYMASLQACFLSLSFISIAGRVILGFPLSNMSVYLVPCIAGVVCGIFPGLWVHKNVDAIQLKKIIYIFMCVAGVYIAVKG